MIAHLYKTIFFFNITFDPRKYLFYIYICNKKNDLQHRFQLTDEETKQKIYIKSSPISNMILKRVSCSIHIISYHIYVNVLFQFNPRTVFSLKKMV